LSYNVCLCDTGGDWDPEDDGLGYLHPTLVTNRASPTPEVL